MKPSSRDHQLELASPLKLRGDSKRLRGKLLEEGERAGCKSPRTWFPRGEGENFFLDILFYRMSEIADFVNLCEFRKF
jgi:hypothetical protein